MEEWDDLDVRVDDDDFANFIRDEIYNIDKMMED